MSVRAAAVPLLATPLWLVDLLFCAASQEETAAAAATASTLVSSMADLEAVRVLCAGVAEVAIDCEGVNLSRLGSVTLLTLAVPVEGGEPRIFHFDFLHSDAEVAAAQAAFLKDLLSSGSIKKLIHDCKMDGDALLHLHAMSLENVVDTQVLDGLARGDPNARLNLNKALLQYGCPTNDRRGSVNYDTTPRYWETRPLTPEMLEYASGDVAMLFQLRDAQLARLDRRRVSDDAQAAAYAAAVNSVRAHGFSDEVSTPKRATGRVIGKGGATLFELQRRSGCCICTRSGHSLAETRFFIIGPTAAAVAQAKASIVAKSRETGYY